ncbi:Copper resistance protein CopC [Corynebacterium kutscheri]|uniref:Copper resistance protein CopC n=1 Tax=Corynebacterium kutscheri TaxID=35755 RepID=A0A0F6TDL3_9CORY|nr:copper resistance CopC family protein [Corynebacterium kutscheri]AKE41359.1 uncharacterized protein, copper resistance protein CopC-like protein [Corynebacterium kutscheri]VEH08635.1 Copper resistance protein CopC [Corynebacterium kutscheri]VEH09681.1 Copper resistance protein CopC [Corynebacterium kutscheri]VEH79764.1 Copper resistance protein CopC [Corynebacterium kutscheri]
MKFRNAAAITVATAAMLMHAPTVSAHDAVIGSTPQDGSVISEFPTQIVLEFSGIPKEGFNTIAVSDQDQNVLFTGEPTLVANTLTLDVPDEVKAQAGEYTVGFQITSSDGHATRGKTTFTLSGGQTTSASPTSVVAERASDTETTSNSGMSELAENSDITALRWFIVGGAVLVMSAVIASTIARNRKTKETEKDN